MTELRTLRRSAGLTQHEFAALLAVPVNTFRMWDSGLRSAPVPAMARARTYVSREARDAEPVGLANLADEIGVHVQTLQRAVRSGRMEASFSTRSAFGQPLRFATRAAAARFMAVHYHRRLRAGQVCAAPLIRVPCDYDQQLRTLRRRMRLSQAALAERVGAAGKAVVYQWESRKRAPSPVFWRRIRQLVPAQTNGPTSPAGLR